MAKIGAPKKVIDWDNVEKMCAIHCTHDEIADIIGVHYATLNNHCKELFGMTFLEWSAQKRAPGKMSLRRRQYTTAMSGNVTMMIWLGKQWLGQSDKQESEQSQKIEITYVNDPPTKTSE